MSWTCKGVCEIDCHKQGQFRKGYASGQRFCRTCDRYFVTDSFRCGCCNQVLRQNKRHHKTWNTSIVS